MLILASRSPRRRELLGLITKEFSVVLGEEDETLPPGTPPEEAVRILAERKAGCVYRKHPLDVVIGADTLVVCEGETLGKPENEADAARMLRLLSGRTHSVFTGVCVKAPGRSEAFAEQSLVTFYSLSEEEIAAYVASGEPMDKAGAYGIQELGALLVRRIEGDYFNIVGLPVARLHQLLRKTGLSRLF